MEAHITSALPGEPIVEARAVDKTYDTGGFTVLRETSVTAVPTRRPYRTKLWGYGEHAGDYAGIYQWDGTEEAEEYASALLPILRRLSNRESVTHRVHAGETLAQHLACAVAGSAGNPR